MDSKTCVDSGITCLVIQLGFFHSSGQVHGCVQTKHICLTSWNLCCELLSNFLVVFFVKKEKQKKQNILQRFISRALLNPLYLSFIRMFTGLWIACVSVLSSISSEMGVVVAVMLKKPAYNVKCDGCTIKTLERAFHSFRIGSLEWLVARATIHHLEEFIQILRSSIEAGLSAALSSERSVC